ncbi:MAG: hypothetical protein FWB73_00475 [Treponema sp.]|nr:hypothetical protein [Treponema sp.]
MNEKIKSWAKKNLIWLIIVGILLIGCVCGIIAGTHFYHKYTDLNAIVESADGGDFVELALQHEATIIALQHDLGAAVEYGRSAIERAEHAERINDRIGIITKQANAESIEFRNAMANTGSTIREIIEFQQRTIDYAGRVDRNNKAVEMELGMRYGENTRR